MFEKGDGRENKEGTDEARLGVSGWHIEDLAMVALGRCIRR